MQDFRGHACGQVGEQKHGRVAHVVDRDVAPQRRERLDVLEDLSELAFATLDEAMRCAEFPTAIQAAKIALDRSGFGPASTLHLDTQGLEEIPTETLLGRAAQLMGNSPNGKIALEKILLDARKDRPETLH